MAPSRDQDETFDMTTTLNAVSLIIAVIAAGPTVEVRQLSGQTITGTLVEMSATSLTIQDDDAAETVLETSDLLGITPTDTSPTLVGQGSDSGKESKGGIPLVLTDGSRLWGSAIAVHGTVVTITPVAGDPPWKLPGGALASVRFVPSSPKIDEQWNEIVAAPRSTDVLVVDKGDSLDYLDGVLGDITEQTVQFDLDGEALSVKRSKVAGLLYYHSKGAEVANAVCRVHGRGGLLLMASDVSLAEGAMHVATASGMQLDVPWNEVRYIDFSQGKVAFLSDLQPEIERWTPYFEARQLPTSTVRYYTPRRDQAFDGGPLRLGGKIYRRGLAIRSRTELVYRLPGEVRRFVAIAGIDDRMRPQGHVQLMIYADDRSLLACELGGGDAPKSVDLDLTGATRLRIVVDFGQDLDISDHFDLCDARIVK